MVALLGAAMAVLVLSRHSPAELEALGLRTFHRVEPFLIAAAVLLGLGLILLVAGYWRRTWRRARGTARKRGAPREPAAVVLDQRRPDTYPLGRRVDGGRVVALRPKPYELSTVAVLGHAGSGKSTILARAALHQVRHGGRALAFLDPHRQAVDGIWSRLTEEERARTVYLDPSQGRVPIALNMLDASGLEADQLPARALELRELVGDLCHAHEGHRVVRETIGRTVTALLQLNAQVPPEEQLTLFAASRWLTDEEWREQLLPYLDARQRGYWSSKRADEGAPGPLLDLLDKLLAAPGMVQLLGHSRSTWDAGAAMDRGEILLAALGAGIGKQLLGNLLALAYVRAALARQVREPGTYREAAFMIDEAPVLDRALVGPMGEAMRECRKFGLSVWLGSQYLTGALSERTVRAIFANRTLLLTASLGDDDARVIARNTGGAITSRAIVTLGPHRFLCQVRRGVPFVVESVPLDREYPVLRGAAPQEVESPRPDPEEAEERALAQLRAHRAAAAPSGQEEALEAPGEAAVRRCQYRLCGQPLSPSLRAGARYCSDAHRQAEGRLRRSST